MLQCGRIDVSQGIDTNKSNEYMICHYWYFKNMIINLNHMC